MSDDFVENLKKPSAWLRILFMAGFVVALYVSGIILMVIMLAQILFSLLTADDNPNLRRLGGSLAAYVAQILAFLTYNTDQKPFPFLPFPSTELPVDGAADVAAGFSADVSSKQSDQPAAAAPAESDNEAPQAADLPSDAQSSVPPRKTGSSRRKKPAAPDQQDFDD